MPADVGIDGAVLKRECREHQEYVPDVDGLGHAVLGPYSGVSAANRVTVLEVVMNERGVVQQLAGRGHVDRVTRVEA